MTEREPVDLERLSELAEGARHGDKAHWIIGANAVLDAYPALRDELKERRELNEARKVEFVEFDKLESKVARLRAERDALKDWAIEADKVLEWWAAHGSKWITTPDGLEDRYYKARNACESIRREPRK